MSGATQCVATLDATSTRRVARGSIAWEPKPLKPVEARNLRGVTMRGVLLWLIGIPIPIIILLYLFNVF